MRTVMQSSLGKRFAARYMTPLAKFFLCMLATRGMQELHCQYTSGGRPPSISCHRVVALGPVTSPSGVVPEKLQANFVRCEKCLLGLLHALPDPLRWKVFEGSKRILSVLRQRGLDCKSKPLTTSHRPRLTVIRSTSTSVSPPSAARSDAENPSTTIFSRSQPVSTLLTSTLAARSKWLRLRQAVRGTVCCATACTGQTSPGA